MKYHRQACLISRWKSEKNKREGKPAENRPGSLMIVFFKGRRGEEGKNGVNVKGWIYDTTGFGARSELFWQTKKERSKCLNLIELWNANLSSPHVLRSFWQKTWLSIFDFYKYFTRSFIRGFQKYNFAFSYTVSYLFICLCLRNREGGGV